MYNDRQKLNNNNNVNVIADIILFIINAVVFIVDVIIAIAVIADKNQPTEFYDFLQVNTDSTKSEVIDNTRKDDQEVDQKAREQQSGVPFIDFLSVRS